MTEKTVTGTFEKIYNAFDEAGKVSDQHEELKAALQEIPQSDMDALVQHVIQTYKNLEGLHVIGLAFEAIPPGILAKVTFRFGDKDLTLAAPFDEKGAKDMLDSLKEAVGQKSSIIQLN